jgi:hypothetical protein
MGGWAAGRFVVAGALLLAGCATGGGEAPRRPAVSVADQVGTVDRSLLVGTWQCRDLNPYSGAPQQTVTQTFGADGTFRGDSSVSGEGPVGLIQVSAVGKWAVQGERLVTSDVTTKASSADPTMNLIAGLTSQYLNSQPPSLRDGSSDVLELTRSRLVTRPAGIDDPPVIACTR